MGGHAPVHHAAGAARCCSALLALAVTFALPAVAGAVTTQTRLVAVGRAPSLQGGALAGAVAPATVVQAEVVLQPRDPAALAQFATDVSTPGSPDYHQFLAPGQFGQEFGATPATVQAVDAALLAQGLQPGTVSANGLAIPVTVTAATADGGFHVSLERVRLPSGQVAFANTAAPQLPAGVAGVVQGVLGLSDLPAVRPAGIAAPSLTRARARPARTPATNRAATTVHLPAAAHVADAGSTAQASEAAQTTAPAGAPTPCSAASAETMPSGGRSIDGYTSDEIASAYGADPLYAAGDLGATPSSTPVTVAIAELGGDPDLTSDVDAFEQCYGINTSVTTKPIDGGTNMDASDEVTLDVDNVIGLAPQANVVLYAGPNSDQGAYDTYSAIFNASPLPEVVSTSWGECESATDPGVIDMEATLFEQAAAQGQSVFAASGDNGSEDCEDVDANDRQLAVDDPGSQPFVTDVGGTSIVSPSTPPSEKVWNNAAGAGGGGVSSGWTDAEGDPEPGWAMPSYQSSSTVAGIVEPTYSSDTCGINADGSDANEICREVPDVSADADPSGGYIVYWTENDQGGPWAILGGTSGSAPTWAGLTALIDATPACAAAGGVGFLNPRLYQIAGAADAANALNDITVGNNDWGNANNGSYPAGQGYDMASGLGTPDVGAETGSGLAAQLCEPTISSITPSNGSPAGGYTVTITGSGFASNSTVTFGSTAATAVAVQSSTQLTATAPAGSGTVNVSITNAAGASAASSKSTFTYGGSGTSNTTTTNSTTNSTSSSTSTTTSTTATADTTTSTTSTASRVSSAVVSSTSHTTSSHTTTSSKHTVTTVSKPTLHLALSQHGYSIGVGSAFCPRACTVATTASAKVAVTQTKRGRKVTKIESMVLGKVSAPLAAGARKSLSLALSTVGTGVLRNHSHVTASVAVTLHSKAGNRSASGRLALVRPRG